MQNLLNDLTLLLEQDLRLVAEGKLLKNKIVELALALDAGLIKLLLSHDAIKKHFFVEVENVLVFDKIKFQRFVSNKQFLPDSYTAYKNKIGLTANGDYLTESKEVVLAWPYKDCVLEGGQDKEDAKRNEVFWNETLAPDQIDRLLAPKVLTGFKRYDQDGEHAVTELSLDDNLIIKGNNLLALHTLKEVYAGKVKLIYIDPPYNTGSDSFGYNDSFNHSAWLTFMKNRLDVAFGLLRKDGIIFVQCDDSEQAYLKVILDDVFGRGNFCGQFVWEKKKKPSFLDKNMGSVVEYILAYSPDRTKSPAFIGGLTTEGKKYPLNNAGNKLQKIIFPAGVVKFGFQQQTFEPQDMSEGNIVTRLLDRLVVEGGTNKNEFRLEGEWRYSQTMLNEIIESGDELRISKVPFRPNHIKSGGEQKKIKNLLSIAHYQMATYEDSSAECIELFGTSVFDYPKPEKLIETLISSVTEENDIVLDFNLGSGTTAAVAHKMGRRYIGVEQMDYIETITLERLKKVISGEQGGISKAVNWQGGGSFVYCELSQANQEFIDQIQAATSSAELQTIWQTMQEKAFLSHQLNPEIFDANASEFAQLAFADQQRFLIEVLDKNLLYVPYSEMDDASYAVSKQDKVLNKQFFNLK